MSFKRQLLCCLKNKLRGLKLQAYCIFLSLSLISDIASMSGLYSNRASSSLMLFFDSDLVLKCIGDRLLNLKLLRCLCSQSTLLYRQFSL